MRKIRIWLLHWIGHAISRGPMAATGWLHDKFYAAYNWCMSTSCDLDDDEWLWKSVETDDSGQNDD